MTDKPSYCNTEETEDGSSQEIHKTIYINSLEQTKIIDVWAHNFYYQMERIISLSKRFNVIAFDTQFPTIQSFNQNQNDIFYPDEYKKYLKLVKNVDNTALIQLGICLSDEQGNVPVESFCWQFNFKYEEDIQQISPSSAFILKKAGINFQKLKSQGINYKVFTHEFIKSGILLNTTNKWVVFHGCYDFSYLLKLIRNECLPKNSQDFYKSIKIYFPQKVDLKCLIQQEKSMRKMGLSRLGDFIKCRRVGSEHQAGSDSLLTLQCYFKLKYEHENVFDNIHQTKNLIYGIGYPAYQKFQNQKLKANTQTRYYNYPFNYPQTYQQSQFMTSQCDSSQKGHYFHNEKDQYYQYQNGQYQTNELHHVYQGYSSNYNGRYLNKKH